MELNERIARGAARSAAVLVELLVLAVFAGGLAAIVYGVALISTPAAWIVGGSFVAGLVALYVRGS